MKYMKTAFNKGIIITILIILISAILFWYKDNKNNEKRYEVSTPLQDKFLITEKLISDFPDLTYDVEIFYDTNAGMKSILKLDNAEDIQNDKINVLYSNNNIKAYSYSNYIIYKQKSDNNFISLDIGEFEKLESDKYTYLIPVAIEITHKSWGFAHWVSEFLLKSNNSDAINTIKRYAEGKFTIEEIRNNEHSGYSKNEMQEYFNSLLKKYNMIG